MTSKPATTSRAKPKLKNKGPRETRINRLAKKFAIRFRHGATAGKSRRVFVRKERKRAKLSKLIAYDFETELMQAGTPAPLYLTAYGEGCEVSAPVADSFDILEILNRDFLTVKNNRAKFVAWNGNAFDAYYIAAALLHSDDYIVRPYLTRSKGLRGLKVLPSDPVLAKSIWWEFLDGIAMLGMQGMPLKKFLESFAPGDAQKLAGPDFENGERFDANNRGHIDYAEMDSFGLYHGLQKAQGIVAEAFNIGLTSTIGNMGIKIFQSHIPERVKIREPHYALADIIKRCVMRGGYCHSVKKYRGPVWKYDLNQAYAAAMRDAKMPCGDAFHLPGKVPRFSHAYIVRLTATHEKNRVPFYYRDIEEKAHFAMREITETWVTSIEHKQLINEGWKIKISESWFWDSHFSMKEYVDKLEFLRVGVGRDPKSAQGQLMKSIGNNSYGKTVENLDGVEMIMARERPEGETIVDKKTGKSKKLKWSEYFTDDDKLSHVWFRFTKPEPRDYHQPQLGAFITAHVRMLVRRAALLNPDAWIYADTDCVVFMEYVPLKCDAKKYGYWRVEAEGIDHLFITKKVYAKSDGTEKHAKGLNRKDLSIEDFRLWFDGVSPIQTQTQKNNFVKVMAGAPMFREQIKTGQIIVE